MDKCEYAAKEKKIGKYFQKQRELLDINDVDGHSRLNYSEREELRFLKSKKFD